MAPRYGLAMKNIDTNPWPVAAPHVERRVVTNEDIDVFGHVNNVRYVAWAMEAGWSHSIALGLDFAAYERIGVGCVVWRHEFDYLAPALPGDEVLIATWIAENDNRVRLVRAFEFRDAPSGKSLFRGRTAFVSIDMASGRPARMPKEFIDGYKAQDQET